MLKKYNLILIMNIMLVSNFSLKASDLRSEEKISPHSGSPHIKKELPNEDEDNQYCLEIELESGLSSPSLPHFLLLGEMDESNF